jgi:murein DD-endopeptidase MepM/ murein hydrolase activator NlpD
VRERLLARIEEARKQNSDSSASEAQPEPERFGSLGGLSEELERIARAPTASPRRAPMRLGEAPLSPNTVALFGVVFGLAALASLFAALSHFAPRGSAPVPAKPVESVAAVAPPAPAEASAPTATATPINPRKKLPGPWRIGDEQRSGYRRFEGKVGDLPFLKAVTNAGIELKQAYRVLAALKEEKNLDRCARSDRFVALVDSSSGRLAAFEYIVSTEEVYQAKENEKNELKGKRLDLKLERVRARGALVMTSESFQDAATGSGFEPSLGSALNKALEGHASVEQFRVGDRLRIIAQEVTVLGEFSRYAGIEAVEYLPVGSDEATRIYYYQSETSKSYVNAKGQLLSESGWRRPVKGAPITSRFNPKRMHPVLKVIKPHTGTDFGAPTGTPVYATLFGTVTFVGELGPNGNFVSLEHQNGYESSYSHLSRFAEGLKVGDRVKTLQLVGYVGSTGRSTGPHLHFSIKKNEKFIDPESLRLDALVSLPAKEREAFAVLRRSYDELLDAIPLPPLPPMANPAPPAAQALEHDAHGDENATQAAATSPPPPVPAAPPAPAAVATPPPANQAAIYLSDRDLMLRQPPNDDGESDE